MQVKLFEVRDEGTHISCFAFRARPTQDFTEREGYSANEIERYILARAGYGTRGDSDCVVMGTLEGVYQTSYDPYSHGCGGRTMRVAHQHIRDNFDTLASGDVVDVQFILGETQTKKISERLT